MSLTLFAAVLAAQVAAEPDASRVLEPTDLHGLSWRSVGPANMGGRVASIAIAPATSSRSFIVSTGPPTKSVGPIGRLDASHQNMNAAIASAAANTASPTIPHLDMHRA